MKRAAVALICLAPTPAVAAPTYLTCSIPSKKDSISLRIVLYPEQGYGAVGFPNGNEQRFPLAVSESTVTLGGRVGSLGHRVAYTVNRVDLSITREIFFAGTEMDRGQCHMAAAPIRAF